MLFALARCASSSLYPLLSGPFGRRSAVDERLAITWPGTRKPAGSAARSSKESQP